MALVERFARLINPAGPTRADDVIADATRSVWDAEQALADACRMLQRPTQPTNDVEEHALHVLRQSIRSARIALRKVPR